MKKYFILFFIIVSSLFSRAQWLWDYGVTVGVSNYLGEIGGKGNERRDFVADLRYEYSRWNFGGFARYKVTPKISAKLGFDYLRISGDDKFATNPARRARNFSFRNDILDLSLTGEYFFYEDNDLGNTYRYKNGFRAYVFLGVGGFHHNPKAYYKGEWVALRPLQTENVKYSAFGVSIPYGVGFYFTINKKHRIGYEMNVRKTFTDYLDDISTIYPDPATMSSKSAALSSRTTELADADPAIQKNYIYNVVDNPGNKRGDPSHKDTYMSMNVSYSYVLRGKSSFYRGHYGNFFGNKKRGKVRKIRAKF